MNKSKIIFQQQGVDTYVCPLCAVIDVDSEGVVCASYNSKLEQLEEENILDW